MIYKFEGQTTDMEGLYEIVREKHGPCTISFSEDRLIVDNFEQCSETYYERTFEAFGDKEVSVISNWPMPQF